MFSRWFRILLTFLTFHLVVFGIPASDVDGAEKKSRISKSAPTLGAQLSGLRQSPVDIVTEDVIVGGFVALIFDLPYSETLPFNLYNDGHTIMGVLKSESPRPSVIGGPLDSIYIFQQFHFHWGSEHTQDGQRFPAEMHLVHFNAKYGSFKQALEHSDGVAVFALIFNHEAENNYEVTKMFSQIKKKILDVQSSSYDLQSNKINDYGNGIGEVSMETFLSLRKLLPSNVNNYYTYDGSLTTPPFSESVIWIVFTEQFYISKEMVTELKMLKGSDDKPIFENFRETQPLNGRVIHMQMQQDLETNYAAISIRLSFKPFVFCILVQLSLNSFYMFFNNI